jgi:hypothetical protein
VSYSKIQDCHIGYTISYYVDETSSPVHNTTLQFQYNMYLLICSICHDQIYHVKTVVVLRKSRCWIQSRNSVSRMTPLCALSPSNATSTIYHKYVTYIKCLWHLGINLDSWYKFVLMTFGTRRHEKRGFLQCPLSNFFWLISIPLVS